MKKRSENEEPKIYLYKGGLSIVGKSGVGSAIRHQEQMLSETRMPVAERWKEAAIVHINTVFPDSLLASWLAKRQGKKVVYYDIPQWRTSATLLSAPTKRPACLKNGSASAMRQAMWC